MSEPALALTDLVLGLVTLWCGWRLRVVPALHHAWRATFAWTAAAALAGFVHHGWITFHHALAGPSFAVVSAMVVVAVSYLLAATVFEVLGPGRRRAFWVLRVASLGAYAALAASGRAGPSSILMAEGVTMALILGLWLRALRAGHPLAPRVVVAFSASAAAAIVQALPPSARVAGLDPVSLYHLAQIPGIVALYAAIVTPPRIRDRDRPELVTAT